MVRVILGVSCTLLAFFSPDTHTETFYLSGIKTTEREELGNKYFIFELFFNGQQQKRFTSRSACDKNIN